MEYYNSEKILYDLESRLPTNTGRRYLCSGSYGDMYIFLAFASIASLKNKITLFYFF